ncbi:CG13587, partial [Drosophila busckii]
ELLLLIVILLPSAQLGSLNCTLDRPPLQFHLVRACQRAATNEALALENTSTLEDCMELARELRGLALNYAPGGERGGRNLLEQQPQNADGKGTARRRYMDARRVLSVFEQPGEYFNCHVLQCPQNVSFAGMTNDSRFDYYSVYGRPTALQNVSCVAEVGLFVIFKQPSNYLNASTVCSNSSEFFGSLAHVVSELRTASLARLLHSEQLSPLYLAYIGLQYNRSISLQPLDFRNAEQESLLCFLYRAWHAGYPRISLETNSSCVALTPLGTWQTVNCEHELPFICEILLPGNTSQHSQLDVGINSAVEC